MQLKRHTAISGTGRAGTTFLISLFHELGLDVGDINPNKLSTLSYGGLELNIFDEDAPYIVKSPALCDQIEIIVGSKEVTLDLLIIPIRDLRDAAESRRRVTRLGHYYGGILGSFSLLPGIQENLLSKKLYKLVYFASSASIPIIFLQFPKFAKEKEYLYSNLEKFLLSKKINYSQFSTAFEKMYKAERIHKFSSKLNIIQILGDLYLTIILILKSCTNRIRVILKIKQRIKDLIDRNR